MRPRWDIIRDEERAAMAAQGHAMLAEAARRLATAPVDLIEAERLIALPPRAEGNALRQFVLTRNHVRAA